MAKEFSELINAELEDIYSEVLMKDSEWMIFFRNTCGTLLRMMAEKMDKRDAVVRWREALDHEVFKFRSGDASYLQASDVTLRGPVDIESKRKFELRERKRSILFQLQRKANVIASQDEETAKFFTQPGVGRALVFAFLQFDTVTFGDRGDRLSEAQIVEEWEKFLDTPECDEKLRIIINDAVKKPILRDIGEKATTEKRRA